MLRNNFMNADGEDCKATKNTYFEHESISNELEGINKSIKEVRNKFRQSKEEYEFEEQENMETPKLPDRPHVARR